MKKLLISMILIVGLFSGCGASAETPKEIVKAYFKAALEGNLDEANSYFSKNAREYSKKSLYRKINGYINFVEDINKFEFEFKINIDKKQLKQISVYLINDTAKGTYLKEHKITKRFNKIKKIPNNSFQFIYENSNWKIKVGN